MLFVPPDAAMKVRWLHSAALLCGGGNSILRKGRTQDAWHSCQGVVERQEAAFDNCGENH
jgi:hypothetical protein